MNGNPYHPAPMTVNRYLGGINKVKLIEYSWHLNRLKTDGYCTIIRQSA